MQPFENGLRVDFDLIDLFDVKVIHARNAAEVAILDFVRDQKAVRYFRLLCHVNLL